MNKIKYNDLGDRISFYEAKLLKQIDTVYDTYVNKAYAETQLSKLRRELREFKAKKARSDKNNNNHISHTQKTQVPHEEALVVVRSSSTR
jgi:hypothetical protein